MCDEAVDSCSKSQQAKKREERILKQERHSSRKSESSIHLDYPFGDLSKTRRFRYFDTAFTFETILKW